MEKSHLPAHHELSRGEIAGRSVNGGGNQSSLRTAVNAAGYADGSRCPSTGHILSMAEQARSSGRYRESGQNGLEELVINGYGCGRSHIVLKMGCGAECSLMAGDWPETVSAADPTVSAARCKVSSSIRDVPIRELNGRDTFRNQPAHGSDVVSKGENANPAGTVQETGY